MAEYRLRPAAEADMLEIWAYSATRWSERQADKYSDTLFDAMEALASQPDRGRACDNIAEGLRRLTSGSHVIFYFAADFGVEVVRVLHGSMDMYTRLADDL